MSWHVMLPRQHIASFPGTWRGALDIHCLCTHDPPGFSGELETTVCESVPNDHTLGNTLLTSLSYMVLPRKQNIINFSNQNQLLGCNKNV